ncbi:MAG: DUF354 domain-containing protein [Calditrichaeota bacterium]|nr:MAG: DUF354 domain-containing protein [Calditrichota bacterium]
MKVLFYLGHPAHYHLFKNVLSQLKTNGHSIYLLIKKKDILEELVKESGFNYLNIQPAGRKDDKLSIALGLLHRDCGILKACFKNRPDIMVGTSTEITHIGKLLKIPAINVNEDDFDAVPLFAKMGYPLASCILAPNPCRTGKWEDKTVHYSGYHELAYLHPNQFLPDQERIKKYVNLDESFFLLRFAKLTAHHDTGKSGITTEIAQKIINILEPKGNIYITSERELESQFEKYRIKINPDDVHHALFYAEMYIGDSQTMAAEAAVLGTPSLRYNDFVGKLGYLDELEHDYGLTFGIQTQYPNQLFKKIEDLVNSENLQQEYKARRNRMLSEKIDVTAFMVWFFENYPQSHRIMRENPAYQDNFL